MTILNFILCLLCIFEVICVPAIFLHLGLQVVILLFLVAVAVLLAILWKEKKLPRQKRQGHEPESGKEKRRLSASVERVRMFCILLIVFQIFLVLGYRHTDDDDAWYLGTAVSAYETGEIFAYSPYTGDVMELSDGGDYVLSPLPILWASLGKLFHIHPTVFAHNIVPVLMILWAYYVYWMLGRRLFAKEKESCAYVFLLLVNVLNLFGYFSIRTSGTFLLFRSWQGKAVFCAILVPLLFYYFLGLLQADKSFAESGENGMEKYGVMQKTEMSGIYLTMGAGCLASFTAVLLMPLLLMAMALTYAVAKRSVQIPLKMCKAMIPNIILAVLYVLVL